MVREVVSMAASGDVLVSIGKDLILCTWSIRTKVTCTGGDYKEDNVNDSLHERILLLYITRIHRE